MRNGENVVITDQIKAKTPVFLEGLHYVIMFYGGRLLSHLCYDIPIVDDDTVVEDFVRLARLNRSACIVMDSDYRNADGNLNQTKKRVLREFEGETCCSWVTKGRTIENYIAEETLNEAIAAVHPRTKQALVWG